MEFLMVRPESWGFRSCGRGWLIAWPHPASTEVDSHLGRLQLSPRSRPAVARRPLVADLAAAKDGMGTLLSDMAASCLVRTGSPGLPTPYSIPSSYKQPAIGATQCIVLRLIRRSDGRWPDTQSSIGGSKSLTAIIHDRSTSMIDGTKANDLASENFQRGFVRGSNSHG